MSLEKMRSLILDKGSQRKRKTVTIDGVEFLITAPSVAERSKIVKDSGANSSGEGADFAKLQVAAVITLVLDPETEKPVFNQTDREALMNLPAGSFLDDLSEAALDLMKVRKGDVEEVEKN